ncbi:hypothetical protein C9374_011071 [Naegleria lovaniensis]|uniref:Protein kinase domain-containing protein n=1 Tax=Naegleria lovaniensis TaxID=51637 RepID=A0AA88GGM3_NAELO|nr:uncharacterized protein C9374_011071 [Naegleria lovaniensis]KAG2374234.1 hypothetical protein C9374_011071 [Naegleria lovaniensis]
MSDDTSLLLPLNHSPLLQWGIISICIALTVSNFILFCCLIYVVVRSHRSSSQIIIKKESLWDKLMCCKNGKRKKSQRRLITSQSSQHEYYGRMDEDDSTNLRKISSIEQQNDGHDLTTLSVMGKNYTGNQNNDQNVLMEDGDTLTVSNTISISPPVSRSRSGSKHLEKIQPVDHPENLLYNDLSKELNDAIVKVSPQLRNMSIMSEELELIDQIGVGSSGIVYKAKYMGVLVAVKQCLICDLLEDPLKEYMKETQILSSIRHPNIVQFIGATIKPPFFYIVTEYCSRGSVDKIIKTSYSNYNNIRNANLDTTSKKTSSAKTPATDSQLARLSVDAKTNQARPSILLNNHFKSGLSLRKKIKLLLDAANGLNMLKSKNIIHRDVKISNFLVTNDWTLKLSDFGTAFHCLMNKQKRGTKVGTIEICAPEVLLDGHYSFKSDVYSFGICVYEFIFEKEIYPNMNVYEITHKVIHDELRPPIPTSQELREMFFGDITNIEYEIVKDVILKLIVKCWSKLENDRPEWDEICLLLRGCLSKLSKSSTSNSSPSDLPDDL